MMKILQQKLDGTPFTLYAIINWDSQIGAH